MSTLPPNPFDLSGHHVLVTGASGMLGESVARRLLRQGWTVRVLQRV